MTTHKPASTRPKFLLLVRYTFRNNAGSVGARDVSAIEHLLRKGKRQVEMYEDRSVKDCWVSGEMREWEKEGGCGWGVAERESERTSSES